MFSTKLFPLWFGDLFGTSSAKPSPTFTALWMLLVIERKKALKIWSNELVYEKTYRLSSHTTGYSLMSSHSNIDLQTCFEN